MVEANHVPVAISKVDGPVAINGASEPQKLNGNALNGNHENNGEADKTLDNVSGHHQQGFSLYQREIYLAGIKGIRPVMTVDPNLWEDAAKKVMTPKSFAYLKGGAGAGETMRKNRRAFERWSIIPRMVRQNVNRNLSINVFGQTWPAPIAIAPMGVNRIFHEDGEAGVARAAGAAGLPYVMSTFSSTSPEDIAAAQDSTHTLTTPAVRWLQLYWPQSVDHDVTRSILHRAKASGYTALVITLDIFSMSWRPADLDNAYLPLYCGWSTALGFSDPVFRRKFKERFGTECDADVLKGAMEWEDTIFPGVAHAWPELQFLRDEWDGPIVVKGIQSGIDAELAVQAGVNGIIVSNHGGRQYDGGIGALDALQEVKQAVGNRVDVFFDSGVRSGADVMKALALGAKAVFVGRPVAYGLGANGGDGALHVMRCLLADFDINFAICGAHSVDDLHPYHLRREV